MATRVVYQAALAALNTPDTQPMLQRLADACVGQASCLSDKDVAWAYAFVLGVIWSWRSLDRGHGELRSEDFERKIDDVMEDIVSFAVPGWRRCSLDAPSRTTSQPRDSVGSPCRDADRRR